MINCVVTSKTGTLITPLPASIYDLYEKLYSVGIKRSPAEVYLDDSEEAKIHVQLQGDTLEDGHLLHLLDDRNTLQDANLLIYRVENASADIKPELHDKILNDYYVGVEDAIQDIEKMTHDSGPIKAVFYCPLTGNIDEGDGDIYTVGNSYLRDYAWAIQTAIEQDFATDDRNMASYFDSDPGIVSKLAAMEWSTEKYRNRLFGKIVCSLKSELTESECETLKEWITGQNSDGWGEHFEQRPIETEDGDLYVSFWHGGNDYSIMTHEELDEYIENQGMMIGGM